jgi:hypothetical protein
MNGFLNDQHRAAFELARDEHRRGGSKAKCCVAKTRGGDRCGMPPLIGQLRCLRHAGPAGARRHRESQLRELAAGRLDPSIFERAERRRAANRLRRAWKTDPWTHGATIDLGMHEEAFRMALGIWGLKLNMIPPAVLDWARWRFRRTHLDRRNPVAWSEVLDTLPKKIAAAGTPGDEELPAQTMASQVHIVAEKLSSWSRRRRAEAIHRGQKTSPTLRANRRGSLRQDADALWDFLAQHRRDLMPILALCRTDEERLRVAAAYRDLIAASDHPTAARAWSALLRELSSERV